MLNHMHFQMVFSLEMFPTNFKHIWFLSSMYVKSQDHMLNQMHLQILFSSEMFPTNFKTYIVSLQYVC